MDTDEIGSQIFLWYLEPKLCCLKVCHYVRPALLGSLASAGESALDRLTMFLIISFFRLRVLKLQYGVLDGHKQSSRLHLCSLGCPEVSSLPLPGSSVCFVSSTQGVCLSY